MEKTSEEIVQNILEKLAISQTLAHKAFMGRISPFTSLFTGKRKLKRHFIDTALKYPRTLSRGIDIPKEQLLQRLRSPEFLGI